MDKQQEKIYKALASYDPNAARQFRHILTRDSSGKPPKEFYVSSRKTEERVEELPQKKAPSQKKSKVPEGGAKCLEIIRANPGCSPVFLAKEIGKSYSMTLRYVRFLENKGSIRIEILRGWKYLYPVENDIINSNN